ncbi:MAG: caspase family protein [Enhydrobacter sp.]
MKRLTIARRGILAGVGGLLASPAIVRAQGQNGVALVIGNSKYLWEAQLPNVKRVAPDMVRAFQAMGLRTELLQDANREAMLSAIAKFKEASRGARFAAFYFAGHGVSWNKETYVVPVDADLNDPKIVQSLIPVPSINAAMKEAANRLLAFDSCRNNPADGWRQREAKLQARIQAADKVAADLGEANTLTLFSTASGAIALDGPPGENSLFAAALLRRLDAPSVDLQALPAALRRDLLIATDGRQMLWDVNTYTIPFVLTRSGKPSGIAAVRNDPSRIIELNNAYAYASQNGLILPPGLVACRAAASAPEARMIGAYKFTNLAAFDQSSNAYPVPSVLIVLSLPDDNSADLVTASKSWRDGDKGSRWRYQRCTRAGRDLVLPAQNELSISTFSWNDQDSGKYSIRGQNEQGRAFHTSPSPFTRLDG